MPSLSLKCDNGKGRLCGFTDESGATGYAYSQSGNVKAVQYKIRDKNYNLDYEYDSTGRIRKATYPNGTKLVYSYDEKTPSSVKGVEVFQGIIHQGTISSRTVPTGGITGSMSRFYRFKRDPESLWVLSLRKHYDLNNNIRSSSVQAETISNSEDAGNLIMLDASKIYRTAANQIESINYSYSTQINQSFTYDKANRLTSEPNNFYTYDDNGNRDRDKDMRLYYQAGTSRIQDIDNWSGGPSWQFDYDGSGNTTELMDWGVGTQTLTYNAFGQMRSWQHPERGQGAYEEYYYNALRQRTIKDNQNSGEYHFLYGSDGTLLAEVDPSNRMAVYVYIDGEIVAVQKNNKLFAISTDHVGRPSSAYRLEGRKRVWQANNSAFGRAGEKFFNDGRLDFRELNIGLPGQYLDTSSGFWYNGNRYYSQELGRYLQSDPIGLGGGINTYGYVYQNPLKYIDPLGLDVRRCARELGNRNGAPLPPSGSLFRHDYIVVNDEVFSFQAGSNMLWSAGWIDNNEETDNPECVTVSEGDEDFDSAIVQAVNAVGVPTYNVFAYPTFSTYMLGARNCQTWSDDVIDRAEEIYNEYTISGR